MFLPQTINTKIFMPSAIPAKAPKSPNCFFEMFAIARKVKNGKIVLNRNALMPST